MESTENYSVEEIKILAEQLRCPEGEMGLDVARMMNQTNATMITESLANLAITKDSRLLEIGHGNARHLKEIMQLSENIFYFGLDISLSMHREAQQRNAIFVEQGRANFTLYQGNIIPFPANFFDRIMTVNTLYFWKLPIDFLQELFRVLKPSGRFVLTYVEKESLAKLPFSKYGFRLYDKPEVMKLLNQTNFKIEQENTFTENIIRPNNEFSERKFTVIYLKK